MNHRLSPRSLLLLAAPLLALTACEYSEVNGIGTRTADEDFPPQNDLTSFEGCTLGEWGRWAADGTVTNNTLVVSTYEVTVAFYQGDTRLEERSEWIRDLKPGETADIGRGWFLGESADKVTDCSVLTINRFG